MNANQTTPQSVTLIGIDCATDPKKTGLAVGDLRGKRLEINEATVGTSHEDIVSQIAGWIDRKTPTVLALDAPLGWPTTLGRALIEHAAGSALPAAADAMFRRRTDDFICERLKKRSLDVGADRIARTAHAALALLERLRANTYLPIPLAWTPQELAGTSAIEVYPAATLVAHGFPSTGYKGGEADAVRARRRLVTALAKRAVAAPPPVAAAMRATDHAADAVVAVLAAADFVRGVAMAPQPLDRDRAQREGWIWARSVTDIRSR
jgi:hypothetical protein